MGAKIAGKRQILYADRRSLSFLRNTAYLFAAGTLCRELACIFLLASPSREIAARLWLLGLCAQVSLPETAERSRSALLRRQAGGGVSEAEAECSGCVSGNDNSKRVCVTFHCLGDRTITVEPSGQRTDDLTCCTDVENEVRKG